MDATAANEVVLSEAQVAELKEQLAVMRHDVNNHISLIMAAVELITRKPEAAARLASMMEGQPARVSASMKLFTAQLEAALGSDPR
jgi:hypothetical protein